MNTRVLSIMSRIAPWFSRLGMFLLILLFVVYETYGRIGDVPYAFYPILIMAITFTMLSGFQAVAAREAMDRFWWPFSFRWVMFAKFITMAWLLWWLIATHFWPSLWNQTAARLTWLALGLAYLWFQARVMAMDDDERMAGAGETGSNSDH